MSFSFRIEVNNTQQDVLARLMAITDEGFHSRIWYCKADGTAASERVIEPRQLADGKAGLLVRALQIQPEKGPRTFCVAGIERVEPEPMPLSQSARKRNVFSSGEVVTFREADANDWKEAASDPASATSLSTPRGRAAWTSPWFNKYVAVVRDALIDMKIDLPEYERVKRAQKTLGLEQDQIRAAHAYILAEEMLGFSADGWIDEQEDMYLKSILVALEQLGWAPNLYGP